MKKFLLSLVFVASFIIPLVSLADTVCRVNGEIVPCPEWLGGASIGMVVFMLAVFIVMIVSTWKIFQKAGEPGWASIVPIYNLIVMSRISGLPIWIVLLMFIPFVSIFAGIALIYGLTKSFGKGIGFMLGLLFLPFIFLPILAFGKSQHITRETGLGSTNTLNTSWKHPESQADEAYLGNFTRQDFENKLRWESKRMGQIAYDKNGTRETNMDLFPVFVKKEELQKAGLSL
ncbi:MAG: DUF5684 domain-containing protein [Patescibacteria group bacterium]